MTENRCKKIKFLIKHSTVHQWSYFYYVYVINAHFSFFFYILTSTFAQAIIIQTPQKKYDGHTNSIVNVRSFYMYFSISIENTL